MTPPTPRALAGRDDPIDVPLTMRDMAVIREALKRQLDGLREAIAPFGLVTTWDAPSRLEDVLATITEARCNLKRRQHPDYNPAGDSECEGFATDAESDAWTAAHPDPELAPPSSVSDLHK